MDSEKSIYSEISKIGPLFKIEGGLIFKHPFRTQPLKGYEENKVFRDSEPFLRSVSDMASDWFEKFPNCCDNHKEIAQLGDFNKMDFDYIPAQIINSIKYLAHAIETFIGEENGIEEIKDYLDYLNEGFGRPGIGDHIFLSIAKHFIVNGTVDGKDFTDDLRLELLEHLEPTKPPADIEERDLGLLYTIFQKWLDAMPNIGRFRELKDSLAGKIPMNIFIIEPKFNKYLGISSFKTRSKRELIEFLIQMTNNIMSLSRLEISKEKYSKDVLILAAEERLKVKQDKLLEAGYGDLELNYLDLVEKWLSIIIEYYQVLNQAIEESKSTKIIDDLSEVKTNVSDILSKIDELQLEIAALCNSDKILNWLKIYLNEGSFKELMDEIEKQDEADQNNKALLDILTSKLISKGTVDYKIDEVKKKADSPDLSIKHKLKFSIPLFLFTTYEGEFELSDKKKLPKSLKELRSLFLE